MFGHKFKGNRHNHKMTSGKIREISIDKMEKVKGVKDYDRIRTLVQENTKIIKIGRAHV